MGVVDASNEKVASAKGVQKWAALLNCVPAFKRAPAAGEPAPPLEIVLPGGTRIESDRPDANKILSAFLGREVKLHNQPPATAIIEMPAGTVGGKYASLTETPIGLGAPPGSFFDYAPVHLLTSATLKRLCELYPQGRFARQRFRPNIVVGGDGEGGFPENDWIGRCLAIGKEVVLRIKLECPRCVMTTLAQGDLPLDPRILRTAAQHNSRDLGDFGTLPCVGVYAEVVKCGLIRPGDPVRVIPEP